MANGVNKEQCRTLMHRSRSLYRLQHTAKIKYVYMKWWSPTNGSLRTHTMHFFVWWFSSYIYSRWLPSFRSHEYAEQNIFFSLDAIDAIRSKDNNYFINFFASICIRGIRPKYVNIITMPCGTVFSSFIMKWMRWNLTLASSGVSNALMWFRWNGETGVSGIYRLIFESLLSVESWPKEQRTQKMADNNDDKKITRNKNYAFGRLTLALR